MEGDDDEEFQDMEDDNIGDFMHLEEMLLPGDPINGLFTLKLLSHSRFLSVLLKTIVFFYLFY